MQTGKLLAGRRALVTGAAGGIGWAIARAMGRAGAEVAVGDLREPDGERIASQIGWSSFGLKFDVTDAGQVEEAFQKAVDRLGGLDIVCANAGISSMNRVVDLTEEEWDANMAVNAKGVFLTNRAAARQFLKAKTPGAIVNIASVAGLRGAPLVAHYAASKFAVIGFTQSLAREVAPESIRVNAVCPGFVRTPMQQREIAREAELNGSSPDQVVARYISMTPLGRLEEPEDVADVVVFLASDAARFITGQAVNVSGGVFIG